MKFKQLKWHATSIHGGWDADDPWQRFAVFENATGKGVSVMGVGEKGEWAEAETLEAGKQICQKVFEHIMAQWVES